MQTAPNEIEGLRAAVRLAEATEHKAAVRAAEAERALRGRAGMADEAEARARAEAAKAELNTAREALLKAATGQPTDHPTVAVHPALERQRQVLRTGEELLAWLQRHGVVLKR